MPVSTLRPSLQLQLMPAGCRLDFAQGSGHYAQVYRRSHYGAWQCLARNARSPFIDRSALPPGAPTEYVVLYHDADGRTTGATSIVAATAAQLPRTASVLQLR